MMKKVLITGKNSYIGTSVEKWLLESDDDFTVDTVDTMNDNWKNADFGKYDVVFHVAGIAHVNAKKSMEALYYKVNRDLTIELGPYIIGGLRITTLNCSSSNLCNPFSACNLLFP